MANIALIAALDRRHAIGRGNALPWHLPADLKRFKTLTLGHAVLMGRKTAESIGRALPGRRNLVLSRRDSTPFDGQETVPSLDAACDAVGADSDLIVIGGGEIYALALARAQRMHLTWVDTVIEDADTFFPPFDVMAWRVIAREKHVRDERHKFSFEFVDYDRSD